MTNVIRLPFRDPTPVTWLGFEDSPFCDFPEKLETLADAHWIRAPELYRMVSDMALAELAEGDDYDPLIAEGVFRSLNGTKLDYALDVREALALAKSDAWHGAEHILPCNPSVEQLCKVLLSALGWERFWAVRSPNPAMRLRAQAAALEIEAAIRVIWCGREAPVEDIGVVTLMETLVSGEV